MIDIKVLKKYYQDDMVIASEHASERFRQKNIKACDIKQAVLNREIIEQYMKCLSCKTGNTTESTNTYFANLKNCYVIIENVPCLKCDQCGEVFYKSSVLENIDIIIEKIENVSSKIFIMDYTTSA